jgi:hypothetical protein
VRRPPTRRHSETGDRGHDLSRVDDVDDRVVGPLSIGERADVRIDAAISEVIHSCSVG